ncbi:MAG: hypothetical protein IJR16_07600 [Spirochaetales bacterium]|nr:hypothetical protein [Spirochaetales bacterium]
MEIASKQDFDALQEQVVELKNIINVMLNRIDAPKVVKVEDIAKMEGVSKSQLNGKEQYLLPRFGVSAYPVGVRRWDLQEYLEWRSINPEIRYQMWKEHLEQVRLRNISA